MSTRTSVREVAIAAQLEIKASGPAVSKDLAAAVLMEAGSSGVIEEGAPSPLAGALLGVSPSADPAEPAFDEGASGATVSLTAYLPSGGAAFEVAASKLARIGWSATAAPYSETDWAVKWKAGIRPVREGGVVIRPPWKDAKRRPGDVVVTIEPGMAFGTGRHETTRMCLRAIETAIRGRAQKRRVKRPGGGRARGGGRGGKAESLLDVGTGTGLLAIAAKRLGCKRVVGIDIDAEAVKSARMNARVNRAAVSVSSTPVNGVRGRFDVVVANILSGELKRLAPAIAARVAVGGLLILSGILTHEADSVADAYGPLGLKRKKLHKRGEWGALVMERTGGAERPAQRA